MNPLETHKRTRWTRIRIIVVAVILALAAGRIMARSWEIQVVKKDDYQRKAKEQQLRSVQLPPTRGAILDRNGNDMAISVMVPSIYANPDEVKDPAGTARQLSPVLQLSMDELMSSLQSKKSFAWLKRRVTREEAQEVKKLELPGINVTQESKRFYPNRRLASHVLGFGGYDAVGLEGLEFEFDKELIGPKPVITGLRDAMGRMIFAEGLSDEGLGRENKIVLTIDKAIQSIAEQELAEFTKLFEAKAASIVVVRPKTGEILAIANVPDFNPNLYWKFQPEEKRNRAVTDRFEPGSTMKIFTMAAALDSGSVKLTDLFYCQKGEFQVDDLVIRDAGSRRSPSRPARSRCTGCSAASASGPGREFPSRARPRDSCATSRSGTTWTSRASPTATASAYRCSSSRWRFPPSPTEASFSSPFS
jgi:cell division protein FtsI (penicillin-binding protein 3)